MLCGATVLWLMLWAGINTGPWALRHTPTTAVQLIGYVRAAFPLGVLLVAFARGQTPLRGGLPGPSKLWFSYGVVGFGAAILSPAPIDAMYWGANYLAVFVALAAYLRGGAPLRRAIELNWITWVATTGILAILCIVARDTLQEATQGSMSSCGKLGSIGGMPMVRSSGMARFAAVPGVLAYVMLWRDRAVWRRVFWAVLLAGACLLLYVMQSRGASFSLAFALVAVTYVLGARARLVGAAALVMGALAIGVELVPQETVDRVATHITRGESVEDMRDMTGRTRDWALSRPYIAESPLVGYGFQADRFLGFTEGGHIHNTYFYVTLTAGLVGLALFVAGLGWAWIAAWQALKRKIPARLGQEAVFAQTVGILAFFTLRSIPEVSGGMFGVDLMVMVPAMAYLAILARDRKPVGSHAPNRPAAGRQRIGSFGRAIRTAG